MKQPVTGVTKKLDESENAFQFMDVSEVVTNATIVLGVVHHVLRPDEWLILRTIDWFESLNNVFLGGWIIGFVNVVMKLLEEHFHENKVKLLEDSELWMASSCLLLWILGKAIYHGRFNQALRFTRTDRQQLVDEIDKKLKLKYKRND